MRVVIQYRAGQVPDADAAANEQALWQWVEWLQARPEHEQTVVLAGGRTIDAGGDRATSAGSTHGTGGSTGSGSTVSTVGTEYDGDVFGISVLRVSSVAAATELVADWPEFAYGGRLDVLAELPR